MSFLLDEEKTWIQRDFSLDRRLIKALSKLGYTYPTMVQSRCIPIALQGKDVLVRARTGAGKTVAFSLPLLHKVLIAKGTESNAASKVQGLILAPTKELCKQIEKHVAELIYYCRDMITICSLADDNMTLQQHRLQSKPDIVISTPARLVQLLRSNTVDLSGVKTLVIDEADLVLSFGYTEDVHTITAKMPKIFQGLLMSATLSPELEKFKRVLLHNPAVLRLEEEKGVGELLQFYLAATESDKFLILYVFIKLGLLQGKGLIFVNDVNKCYKLKLFLQQFFINAAVLNSEVPAASRMHMLEEFNRGVFDYLIATDSSVDQGEEDEEDDDEDLDGEDEDADDAGNEGDDDDEDEDEEGEQEEEEDEGEEEVEGAINMKGVCDSDDDEEEGDDSGNEENFDVVGDEDDDVEEEPDDEEDLEMDDSTEMSSSRKRKSRTTNPTTASSSSSDGDGDMSGKSNKKSITVKGKESKKNENKNNKGSSSGGGKGKNGRRRSGDQGDGYGVSRGIDFQGVTFVINFDFPATAAAYTHRIGRTARGGASGTALSFVSLPDTHSHTNQIHTAREDASISIAARDAEVLRTVRAQQPRLGIVEGDNVLAAIGDVQDNSGVVGTGTGEDDPHGPRMQPAPLNFNMAELESFRYRVEDTTRSVTNAAVKEFRTAEIKREILHSTKLKTHFMENPNDLKVLRHDKANLHPIVQKDHLKHVPEYLIPHSMRSVARSATGGKRKKRRKSQLSGGQGVDKRIQMSKQKDPLLASGTSGGDGSSSGDLEGQGLGGDNSMGDDGAEGGEGGDDEEGDAYSSSSHQRSMSGRQQWKMRHNKGKFNPKQGKKNEHRLKGSFVKAKRFK